MTTIKTSTAQGIPLAQPTPNALPDESAELGRELLRLHAESQAHRDKEREQELARVRELAKFD